MNELIEQVKMYAAHEGDSEYFVEIASSFMERVLHALKSQQERVANLITVANTYESELDRAEARVAELERKLVAKSDRVALLESEMQIPDAKNYKTALEEAFDACSIAIDGNAGWEYPGQMIRAVEAVVRERDDAEARLKLRPMSEAPRDGRIRVLFEAMMVEGRAVAIAGDVWDLDSDPDFLGWLPDERKEGE